MARTKRFVEGGDSNAGMKEKRDLIDAEIAAEKAEADMMTRSYKPEAGMKEKEPEAGMMEKEPEANFKYTPKPAAKPAPKVDVAAIIAKGQANNEADRKATEAAEAKALEQSKTTTTTAKASAPAKKETYRDFSGNIQTKKSTADRDSESSARREKAMDAVKSVGSGIGSLFSKAMENYRSTRPRYNKEKKMASGGKVSSASSRGDGIASRGKTRGKVC